MRCDARSSREIGLFCTAACQTPTETDTTVVGFDAGPGYDLASGLGTIDADHLVRALRRGEEDRSAPDR